MERLIALPFYLALVAVGIYFTVWIYHPGDGLFALTEGIFLILSGGVLVWLDYLSPNREGALSDSSMTGIIPRDGAVR
jgi:hypothetical protein